MCNCVLLDNIVMALESRARLERDICQKEYVEFCLLQPLNFNFFDAQDIKLVKQSKIMRQFKHFLIN